jgi:GNAT superfamily N-acetyltransferase
MAGLRIRTLAAGERDAWLALLDGWALPDGWRGRVFFARYAESDPTFAPGNVFVAEREGRLVSTAQIFPRRLRVAGADVPTAGIGSVFSAPDARGEGLASAVLEAALSAMRARGFELSLLFAGRHAFYGRLGWALWPRARDLWLREGGTSAPSPDRRVDSFDPVSDLAAVVEIHRTYAIRRDGSVVRDLAYWRGQLCLAGNPDEDFLVERDACGAVRAYARGCCLQGFYCVTEVGRRDAPGAAEALAELVVRLGAPLEPDPVADRAGRGSAELRRAVLAPPHGDAALDAALARRGVAIRRLQERTTMLAAVDVDALARRLGAPRGPAEPPRDYLLRTLPPDRFSFWPSDRF